MAESKWKISKPGYFADFILIPIYMILCALAMVHYSPEPLRQPSTVTAFAAGVCAWSVVEYVLHRWVFHWFYKEQHWIHHLRPKALIGVSPTTTAPTLALLFLFLVHVFGIRIGGAFFLGHVLMFLHYGVCHWAIHHHPRPGKFISRLKELHDMHHRGIECNFGITTNLWDRLLGTYKAPKARS